MVLGVYVGYNKNLVDQKNYLDILKNIRRIPNIWKQRGLTSGGKIVIFRTFMLSKVLYIALMSAVLQSFLDELQQIHKDFI